LPTDIIGITAYERERGFYVLKGPIFNNFILADEINRAPPKVQSALLECMQEKQATIGKETFDMPMPFFVLATQNPLEQLGVYPLPEAQVDRFLFKIRISYPNVKEEQSILNQNITTKKFEDYKIRPITSPEIINELQEDAKRIYLDKKIESYIIQIINATRNPDEYKLKLGKYIDWGASPRASIGLYSSSKANALMQGKSFVTPQHVKEVAPDVLRHRVILNYEAESENVKVEDVISEILAKVPVP
jgi:MoxR-like ATPase